MHNYNWQYRIQTAKVMVVGNKGARGCLLAGMRLLAMALMCDYHMPTGAGIYVTNSDLSYSSSSLHNNSIILADTYRYSYWSSGQRRMGFYCCSNYTSAGQDGIFIGLNSVTYSGSFTVSHNSIGCMYIYYNKPYGSYGILGTSEQGIYTCRMPDANRRNIDVSVGIYKEGYNSKLLSDSDVY